MVLQKHIEIHEVLIKADLKSLSEKTMASIFAFICKW